MTEPIPWTLVGFLDRFDMWALSEPVADDLRLEVLEWVLSRVNDPYEGAKREHRIPNLWITPACYIEGASRAVVCSYWIYESERLVKCDNFGTLTVPF